MPTGTDASNNFGKGIYSIPLASKLVGIDATSIRRWLNSFEANSNRKFKMLWRPDLIHIGNKKHITFKDLLELRIIKIFRKHNISYKVLSALSMYISDKLLTENPLVYANFSTDGKNIFIQDNFLFHNITNIYNKYMLLPGISKWFEKELIRIQRDQNAVYSIIHEHNDVKQNEIIFDNTNKPTGWKISPSHFDKIFIYPDRCAGYPMINDIPTSSIFRIFKHTQDTSYIAGVYDIPMNDVKQAIDFEQGLLQ